MALYPTSLSDIPVLAATLDGAGAGEAHTVVHTAVLQEVEAIAAELGTSPSAADATVAARLARIDGLVAQTMFNLTLAAGVTATGGFTLNPRSSKVGLLCTLHGMLSNTSGSTITAGTAIAQVNAAHVPVYTEAFAALMGDATPIRIDVEVSTGQIRLVGTAWPNAAYLTLSGINYMANS